MRVERHDDREVARPGAEMTTTTPLAEKPNAEPLPEQSAASVILNGRYLPPPVDKDGKQWVRASVLVQSDPIALYQMWHDLESVPLWQENITEVKKTGLKTSRWSMSASNDHDGKTLTWDSEILADEPGVRIAWHSTGGDLEQAGEVIFEPAVGGRGTVVTVLQEFRVSKMASAWETLVGREPKQAVIENLRHFKALAETGEVPRSQQDPAGKRGVIGDLKRSMYGETVPTPTGGN
jgi:uncharacterized membrane protein